MTIETWYRQDRLPHIFCAGCGTGSIINSTLRAVDELGYTLEGTTFVSGIGCSSRAGGYTAADSLHTTHGRALAFATGIKLVKPQQHVIVFTGDGDCSAIGGNHFIHACRRNIDLTVICINNNIYGMTGGQSSPCTPQGAITTTTPYGMQEEPFDLCSLAIAAGANYVARWTSFHVKQLTEVIKAGLQVPGLSFIEVYAQCPTAYGAKNKMKRVSSMIELMRDNAVLKQNVDAAAAKGMTLEKGKFVVGELMRRNNLVLGGGSP